jgi:DNA-binding CsgD family transcriptional regulator
MESGADDSIFEERWKVYSGIERDRSATFALQVEALTQKSSKRISELSSELEDKRATAAQWQMLALAIGALLLLVIGGYAIHQRRKGMANQRKLEALLSSNLAVSRVEEFEIKLDDIRTLGDAIAHGKKTSDAMLILKKISMKHMPENFPKQLDLNNLENYSELSTSEQRILKDMIAGLDAKEIARVLKLSPSHIYNSRSNIRRKLEIPKEQSIEDWVIANAVNIQSDRSEAQHT